MHAPLPNNSAGCCAHDFIVYGEPGGDYRRHEHDTKLGNDRIDERKRESGSIRVDIAERHHVDQPGSDDHLYADGDEHFWNRNGDSNSYGYQAEPADDQFIHCEPHWNFSGQREHAELDNFRRDEPLDQPGRNYGECGKRIDAGEPRGDDDLCADGYECRGIGDGVSVGDGIDADYTGD